MSRTGLSDTHPDVERIQIELMRQAPDWRKVEIVGEMWATTKSLALLGLRQRYPQADGEELNRRLADLLLGPELAKTVYGPATY